ncbi:dTMP kinase, partial [Acidobacteriota bacterium]
MNIIVTDLIKINKQLNKGFLFVFEGIDGTGKSTQAENLCENLEKMGYETIRFREPSDSRWGQKIREKA